MQIGIVGKANVGKSTFFKALTLADILIANYPFATIKPNHGVAFVKIDCVCGELNTQCNPRIGMCVNKKRFVAVDVLDVAGLVPGAHEGKGMGNQFLDDIRQADALIHVVDFSGGTNEKGEVVNPGTHDPAFDIQFLEKELDMWILGILKRGWDKFARQIQQEKQEVFIPLAKQLSAFKITEDLVKVGINDLKLDPLQPLKWTEENLMALATFFRRKTKPMVIAANKMDVPTSQANFDRITKQFPEHIIVPVSAESELALKEAANKQLISYIPGDASFKLSEKLSEGQRKALEFIQKNVLDKYQGTGVQRVINAAVFDLLHYVAIFPGGTGKLGDKFGNILPDCFLLPPSSTAIDFANHIHTDLAKNFVAAVDVRARRKIGRDTQLKHRDIVEIMTSK